MPGMTDTITSPGLSWQEERRQDALLKAKIKRDDADAAAIRARDDEAAREKRHAASLKSRAELKMTARRSRAARRQARVDWAGSHVAELLLAPVIAGAVVLAWDGMASYGLTGYGIVGLALPVVSEGGQWAFAAATTYSKRRHPDKPVGHLRAGVILSTLMGMGLNFNHGLTVSLGWAITMALVSGFGITAHQLITAGPNWSRAERARARTARQLAMVKAFAEQDAPTLIDESGEPRKLFTAKAYTVERSGWFRTEIVPDLEATAKLAKPSPEAVPAPDAAPSVPAAALPSPATTVAVRRSEFGTLKLSFSPAAHVPSVPATEGAEEQVSATANEGSKVPPDPPQNPAPAAKPKAARTRSGSSRPRGRAKSRAEVRADVDKRVAEGILNNPQIAAATGASLATVERRRAAFRAAGGNVVQFHAGTG